MRGIVGKQFDSVQERDPIPRGWDPSPFLVYSRSGMVSHPHGLTNNQALFSQLSEACA
jgi:hypothetical protein